MTQISQKTISELTNKIVSDFHPDKIFLFGSYATGSPTISSDLDFIVVKVVDGDMNKIKLSGDIRMSLSNWLLPMDIVVYSPKEFENERLNKFTFLGSVLKNSKLMYERK